MGKITIQEVAQAAGVSKATLSRFLNQNYSHMSEKTRQRIAETVKAMDYRPSRRAQSLKTNHSRLIGIMIADISNVYVSLLLKGITSYLKTRDYQTLIMESGNSLEQEQQQLNQMLDQSVEGIILQPNSRKSSDYDFIAAATVPLVLIDRETWPPQWDTIVTNNFHASYLLGQQAQWSLKPYTMGLVVSENIHAVSTREQRLAGFIEGVAPLNVETLELQDIATLGDRVVELVEQKEHPLIFANNGQVLAAILQIVQTLTLKIPIDVGVAGYDDWNWAGLVSPGISTIEQHPDKIGYLASQTLVKLIQSPDQSEVARIHSYPATIKLRSSI
ncbi:LacI family DNA-binding transcriptional regulator [Lactiplantibacillus herbarum]|uniref:LacI family DNA-binding transcriptional regulator n=1 Tax=Lactiplantibacillus herbarum TaxID=1670446 RepID=UPI00064E44FF|nr:LacI family DNA-binding transcriptional regulator [Lactiplantibacillus herbarum]